MINLHERMLPTSAGVEPATSWSPVGRRIQLSHRGRQASEMHWVFRGFNILYLYFVALFMESWLKYLQQEGQEEGLYRSLDYQINWTSGSGEEVQNRFPRQWPWCHLGFLIGTNLALYYLQVTQMLPTKFGVRWPFGSGGEVKNKFLRWQPWWLSRISNQNDFSYFDLLVIP